jgi:hypothetical protein
MVGIFDIEMLLAGDLAFYSNSVLEAHETCGIQKDSRRNVMDMSANLGIFVASLRKKDVWVMNVVPFTESEKVKVIYDRGLMGTVHNW